MGDILRDHVAGKSILGRMANEYMRTGRLVPDDLLEDILFKAIDGVKTPHVVLDGYPRNLVQAKTLTNSPKKLSVIIHLTIDEDFLYPRIARRSQIEGREDDTPEKLKTRLEVYNKEMSKVFKYYKRYYPKIYHQIDGFGSQQEVFHDIKKVLKKHKLITEL